MCTHVSGNRKIFLPRKIVRFFALLTCVFKTLTVFMQSWYGAATYSILQKSLCWLKAAGLLAQNNITGLQQGNCLITAHTVTLAAVITKNIVPLLLLFAHIHLKYQ